jgi:release factor glutamine methyltransferase
VSEPTAGHGDNDIDVVTRLKTGRAPFLGIEMLCGPGALVPRQETELLAQTAIDILRKAPSPSQVIDMCCGVGNLACAIAVNVPDVRVWASDLTDGAVSWTRKNVVHLGLDNRVSVVQGDLFVPLIGKNLDGHIDAVVCNPPYISTGRLISDRAILLENEPREAFDAGPYGLNIHQRVISEAPRFLKPGGWLLVEVGVGQERQVMTLFVRAGFYEPPQLASDAAGRPRVVYAKRRSAG